ncbi:MAG: hypothetical protein ACRC2R_09730 [Xenococcaceae cyanobacterium]
MNLSVKLNFFKILNTAFASGTAIDRQMYGAIEQIQQLLTTISKQLQGN